MIQIVSNERKFLRRISVFLLNCGYEVIQAESVEEVLDELEKEIPDLIIIDLTDPMLILDLCQSIRKISTVPIIVISVKATKKNIIAALDFGADDFIINSYSLDELIARVRAILRRSISTPINENSLLSASGALILNAGDLTINVNTRRVTVGEKEVKLTPKEFIVLKYLVNRSGKVIPHQVMLQAVWGWKSSEDIEYLRVFINQLRRKIEPDPHHPRYILTEPWVGYRFASGE
jgi:two-component system KDP operon response regulator KdpE